MAPIACHGARGAGQSPTVPYLGGQYAHYTAATAGKPLRCIPGLGELLADAPNNPLLRPLPDGIVPAAEVARTEKRWLLAMVGLLTVLMAVVVVTSMMGAIHPPSNVERINPTTLHLSGEFVESNLGTAQERDGSLTARLVADQYAFVPGATAALGVVAATAGMAKRRNVRVLLGRGAGIVARAGSGNSSHRRDRAHALSAKRV